MASQKWTLLKVLISSYANTSKGTSGDPLLATLILDDESIETVNTRLADPRKTSEASWNRTRSEKRQ